MQILLCRETLVIAVQGNIIEIVDNNYLLKNTPIYLCVMIYSYVSPVFYSKCFVLTISLRYVGYYILCITILNITINAKWTHSKLWHACLCIFMIICFLIFRTKKTDINFSNDRCSNNNNPWCNMTFFTIYFYIYFYGWKYQPLLNNSYLAIRISILWT